MSGMDRRRESTGLRRQPWQVVVLFSFLGWIFMYADRTVLSPVLPLIGGEWELSNSQLGLIASLFFLAYTALQIPVGMAADRRGWRMPLLVGGFVLFGLGTLASGLAPTYPLLLLASVVTGLGESTYYPTQYSLSTEVVPPQRRAIASALINSGQAVGIALGLLVSSYVALQLEAGWRLPFIVLSVPTVLVGLFFGLVVRDPATARTASESRPQERGGRGGALTRDLVLLYVVNFCSLYGFFVILTWLPFYLQSVRGYNGMAVGWISSLVPWLAVPGGLLVSWWSDRLGNRKRIALVMLPIAAVALIAIPLLPAGAGLVAALMVYGLTGKLALDPVMTAYVADHTRREHYGKVFGLFNFAGMCSSVLAPYLTGFVADRTGTLQSGFYMAGGLLVVAMAALAAVREPEAGGR